VVTSTVTRYRKSDQPLTR